MPSLIRAVAFADGSPCPLAGLFVMAYDPDAYNGKGWVDFTADPALALRFVDNVEAFAFWRQRSTVNPTRPDGKPNRPLTSTTIEIVKVP